MSSFTDPTAASATLDAIFDRAPVGLAFWDTGLRYRRINERLAEINGAPVADHLGRRPSDVLGAFGERVEETLAQVVRTGEGLEDVQLSGTLRAEPDVIRHWQTSYYPVLGPGDEPLGVGAVVVETTGQVRAHERERAERRRVEALWRASTALTTETDPDRLLEALASAAVPALADWCAIHVLEGDGTVRQVTLAHTDPERRAFAADLRRRFSSASRTAEGVIASGQEVVFEEVTDADLAEQAESSEHLEALRGLGIRSAVVLPMRARGVTLGALSLVLGEGERSWSEDLVRAARALSSQAAVALDNARLHEERRRVAEAYQRALLPDIPEVPGATVAARYRAAGRANPVGGDFYAVFRAHGGHRVLLGDVTGKGPEATELTAFVRHTAQVAALDHDDVSEELSVVNRAIIARRDRLCSAVLGRVLAEGDGRLRVRLASGGHPPPLLVRCDGTVEEVPVRGTLLGVHEEAWSEGLDVVLDPGDALVLYTDGATEVRGATVADTTASLMATLSEVRCRTAAELAELVEHHALVRTGGELRDDLAALVLRADG